MYSKMDASERSSSSTEQGRNDNDRLSPPALTSPTALITRQVLERFGPSKKIATDLLFVTDDDVELMSDWKDDESRWASTTFSSLSSRATPSTAPSHLKDPDLQNHENESDSGPTQKIEQRQSPELEQSSISSPSSERRTTTRFPYALPHPKKRVTITSSFDFKHALQHRLPNDDLSSHSPIPAFLPAVTSTSPSLGRSPFAPVAHSSPTSPTTPTNPTLPRTLSTRIPHVLTSPSSSRGASPGPDTTSTSTPPSPLTSPFVPVSSTSLPSSTSTSPSRQTSSTITSLVRIPNSRRQTLLRGSVGTLTEGSSSGLAALLSQTNLNTPSPAPNSPPPLPPTTPSPGPTGSSPTTHPSSQALPPPHDHSHPSSNLQVPLASSPPLPQSARSPPPLSFTRHTMTLGMSHDNDEVQLSGDGRQSMGSMGAMLSRLLVTRDDDTTRALQQRLRLSSKDLVAEMEVATTIVDDDNEEEEDGDISDDDGNSMVGLTLEQLEELRRRREQRRMEKQRKKERRRQSGGYVKKLYAKQKVLPEKQGIDGANAPSATTTITAQNGSSKESDGRRVSRTGIPQVGGKGRGEEESIAGKEDDDLEWAPADLDDVFGPHAQKRGIAVNQPPWASQSTTRSDEFVEDDEVVVGDDDNMETGSTLEGWRRRSDSPAKLKKRLLREADSALASAMKELGLMADVYRNKAKGGRKGKRGGREGGQGEGEEREKAMRDQEPDQAMSSDSTASTSPTRRKGQNAGSPSKKRMSKRGGIDRYQNGKSVKVIDGGVLLTNRVGEGQIDDETGSSDEGEESRRMMRAAKDHATDVAERDVLLDQEADNAIQETLKDIYEEREAAKRAQEEKERQTRYAVPQQQDPTRKIDPTRPFVMWSSKPPSRPASTLYLNDPFAPPTKLIPLSAVLPQPQPEVYYPPGTAPPRILPTNSQQQQQQHQQEQQQQNDATTWSQWASVNNGLRGNTISDHLPRPLTQEGGRAVTTQRLPNGTQKSTQHSMRRPATSSSVMKYHASSVSGHAHPYSSTTPSMSQPLAQSLTSRNPIIAVATSQTLNALNGIRASSSRGGSLLNPSTLTSTTTSIAPSASESATPADSSTSSLNRFAKLSQATLPKKPFLHPTRSSTTQGYSATLSKDSSLKAPPLPRSPRSGVLRGPSKEDIMKARVGLLGAPAEAFRSTLRLNKPMDLMLRPKEEPSSLSLNVKNGNPHGVPSVYYRHQALQKQRLLEAQDLAHPSGSIPKAHALPPQTAVSAARTKASLTPYLSSELAKCIRAGDAESIFKAFETEEDNFWFQVRSALWVTELQRRAKVKQLTKKLLAQSLEETIFPSASSGASVPKHATTSRNNGGSGSGLLTPFPTMGAGKEVKRESSGAEGMDTELEQELAVLAEEAEAEVFDPLAHAKQVVEQRTGETLTIASDAVSAFQEDGDNGKGGNAYPSGMSQGKGTNSKPVKGKRNLIAARQGMVMLGAVSSDVMLRRAKLTNSAALLAATKAVEGGRAFDLGHGDLSSARGLLSSSSSASSSSSLSSSSLAIDGGDPVLRMGVPVDYYIRDANSRALQTSFLETFRKRRSRAFLRSLALAAVDREFLARTLQLQMQGQRWWMTLGTCLHTDHVGYNEGNGGEGAQGRLALYDVSQTGPANIHSSFGLAHDPSLMTSDEVASQRRMLKLAAQTVQQRAWTRAARLAAASGVRVRDNMMDDDDDDEEAAEREADEAMIMEEIGDADPLDPSVYETIQRRRKELRLIRARKRADRKEQRLIMAAAGAAVRAVSEAANAQLKDGMSEKALDRLIKKKEKEAVQRTKKGGYYLAAPLTSTSTSPTIREDGRHSRTKPGGNKSASSSGSTATNRPKGASKTPDPVHSTESSLISRDASPEEELLLARGGYSSLMIRLDLHRLGPAKDVFSLLVHAHGLASETITMLPIGARDRTLGTPLHLAASRGLSVLCQHLCRRGADPTATDDRGFTPLDLAIKQGHVQVVSVLLRYGARCTRERALNLLLQPPPSSSKSSIMPTSTYLRNLLLMCQPVPDHPTEPSRGRKSALASASTFGPGGLVSSSHPWLKKGHSSSSSSPSTSSSSSQSLSMSPDTEADEISARSGIVETAELLSSYNKGGALSDQWEVYVHWQGIKRPRNVDELDYQLHKTRLEILSKLPVSPHTAASRPGGGEGSGMDLGVGISPYDMDIDDVDNSDSSDQDSNAAEEIEFYGAVSRSTLLATTAAEKAESIARKRAERSRRQLGRVTAKLLSGTAYAASSLPSPPITQPTYHEGCQVLLSAVMRGDVQIVESVLKSVPSAVGYVSHGCSLLFHASWHGHTDIVTRLLEAKADIDFLSSDILEPDPEAQLHEQLHPHIIGLLSSSILAADAQLYMRRSVKFSTPPKHQTLSAHQSRLRVVGSDVTPRRFPLRTAYQIAVLRQNYPVALALLAYGADPGRRVTSNESEGSVDLGAGASAAVTPDSYPQAKSSSILKPGHAIRAESRASILKLINLRDLAMQLWAALQLRSMSSVTKVINVVQPPSFVERLVNYTAQPKQRTSLYIALHACTPSAIALILTRGATIEGLPTAFNTQMPSNDADSDQHVGFNPTNTLDAPSYKRRGSETDGYLGKGVNKSNLIEVPLHCTTERLVDQHFLRPVDAAVKTVYQRFNPTILPSIYSSSSSLSSHSSSSLLSTSSSLPPEVDRALRCAIQVDALAQYHLRKARSRALSTPSVANSLPESLRTGESILSQYLSCCVERSQASLHRRRAQAVERMKAKSARRQSQHRRQSVTVFDEGEDGREEEEDIPSLVYSTTRLPPETALVGLNLPSSFALDHQPFPLPLPPQLGLDVTELQSLATIQAEVNEVSEGAGGSGSIFSSNNTAIHQLDPLTCLAMIMRGNGANGSDSDRHCLSSSPASLPFDKQSRSHHLAPSAYRDDLNVDAKQPLSPLDEVSLKCDHNWAALCVMAHNGCDLRLGDIIARHADVIVNEDHLATTLIIIVLALMHRARRAAFCAVLLAIIQRTLSLASLPSHASHLPSQVRPVDPALAYDTLCSLQSAGYLAHPFALRSVPIRPVDTAALTNSLQSIGASSKIINMITQLVTLLAPCDPSAYLPSSSLHPELTTLHSQLIKALRIDRDLFTSIPNHAVCPRVRCDWDGLGGWLGPRLLHTTLAAPRYSRAPLSPLSRTHPDVIYLRATAHTIGLPLSEYLVAYSVLRNLRFSSTLVTGSAMSHLSPRPLNHPDSVTDLTLYTAAIQSEAGIAQGLSKHGKAVHLTVMATPTLVRC